MKIYDFKDVNEFIVHWISNRPNAGRGELSKIAKHARIHSSTFSQILGGDRELSLEQAVSMSEYFGLSENETNFFLLLVQHKKASTQALKLILEKQIQEKLDSSQDLSHVLSADGKLTNDEKAVFYSAWFYSAVRLLVSIPEYQTFEALHLKLRLPKDLLNQILTFLVSVGLCTEKKGNFLPGPRYTHLEASSPFISKHHANWRIKAMERHTSLEKPEKCYSAPMSISKKDAEKINRLMIQFIEEVQKIREGSKCEVVYCLNLDWFRV